MTIPAPPLLDRKLERLSARMSARAAALMLVALLAFPATGHAQVPQGQEGISIPVGGLSRDIELELYGTSRTAAPGGVVVVRYNITSYEDADAIVRLRLWLPMGWTLLDQDLERREWFVESWENVEGEIRVAVPRSAPPGQRHRVHLMALVDGEPGGAAVYASVRVGRSGGLTPGVMGLTGSTSVQVTNVDLDQLDVPRRYGGSVDLAGQLTPGATLTLNFRQGPRESSLTNLRISPEETRFSGSLRSSGWSMAFGNQLGSSGTAVTGPFVRGSGASLRRTSDSFHVELTAIEPRSYAGNPGGHLVRGAAAVVGDRGRVGATFSQFERPAGDYSVLPPIVDPHLDPDSLERVEREREASRRAPSSLVQGAGAEAELRAGMHRFLARGGWLGMSEPSGERSRGSSVEASYGFAHRLATLNARWRDMPASLPGIQLMGDEISADGSLRLIGEVRLTARAHRGANEVLGEGDGYRAESGSTGVRWHRGRWQGEFRANQRAWGWGKELTEARSNSLSIGIPMGPFVLAGYAEHGRQSRKAFTGDLRSYRGDLRWNARGGTFSVSTSYYDTPTAPPRLRSDLLASLTTGEFAVSGGAWMTRGWASGGEPGLWTQVGLPISHTLVLVTGIEHAPPAWGAAPAWLGTLGVRRRLTVPLPFLPGDRALREQAGQLTH